MAKPDTLQKFGLKVRQLREDLGLSQEELAARTGFDRTYISLIDAQKAQSFLAQYLSLCSRLGNHFIGDVARAVTHGIGANRRNSSPANPYGTTGRNRGHRFEETLTADLNSMTFAADILDKPGTGHLRTGHPAIELVRYVGHSLGLKRIDSVRAAWLGGLATSGRGDKMLDGTGERHPKIEIVTLYLS